jgi:diguanylate cyclase (GGDEF)-like protein
VVDTRSQPVDPGASSPGAAGPPPARSTGSRRPSTTILAYVAGLAVVAAAVAVPVLVVQLPQVDWTSTHLVHLYAFAALLLAAEQRPLRVARRDGEVDQITVSSTWAVALVICGPLSLVVLAQGAAVALDDMWRRRGLLRCCFNVAQYVVTLVAARLAYALCTDHGFLELQGSFGVGDVPGAVVAGVVFFVVNNGAVGLVLALDQRVGVVGLLVEDVRVQGMTSSILLGLAPVAVVVADFSLWLLPMLVLPLLGVQHSAWVAARRQYEALHDGLTGLANRMLFHRRTDRALSEGRAAGGHVAVMLLDLDHFKEVNDTLGHHVGDDLLRQVAGRVGEGLPDGVTLARLGGDEFAVLLPDAGGVADVVRVAQQVASRLHEPIVADGIRIGVQASIGIAHQGVAEATRDLLLQQADIALYRAKENRGEIQVYRPEIDQHTVQRLSLLADLHAAVERGQFRLLYQPQVDTRTGAAVAVEALMRWHHPTQGVVPPDVFIPLAEQSGIIAALTRAALAQSLTTLSLLHAAGHRVEMAVNISARLLSDLELPRMVHDLILERDVPASCVTIEVTESTITADPRRAMQVLQELRETGIRVAVDDFGTGYSSLSYLRRLQPDELKVDRSFVTHMRRDENSAVIVRSTVDLGHGLGLSVVAEGVEDDETYGLLRELGCDRVQGYVVARPMSLAALKVWLDTAATAGWRTAAQRAAGLRPDTVLPALAGVIDLTVAQALPAEGPSADGLPSTAVPVLSRTTALGGGLPVTKPLPVAELFSLDAAT